MFWLSNVAVNITSLNGKVRLIGLTRIDEPAKVLDDKLTKRHDHCDFVSVSTHPTITKLRVLSRNQQLSRIDFEEGFANIDYIPLLERINIALSISKVLVLSDYAKVELTVV